MSGRVIQGFFIGGGRIQAQAMVRAPAPAVPVRTVQRATGAARPGPPPPAFAPAAATVQARAAPGRPPLAHQAAGVVQRHGTGDSFEIDASRIGLSSGGGARLPEALLAKMEGAFGADFSGVRVHVGPQAERIGAIAFTMGNDLYFAPGRYQPDSVQGQQLIGHELAHVIQQRQGRVRAPGSGIAVVQDRLLEAEADRLGMRAAASVAPVVQRQAVGQSPAVPRPAFGAGAVQCAPAGQVIQAAKYTNTKPLAAKGTVRRFEIDGVKYIEDSQQRRWYWNAGGWWVKIPGKKAPLYNRFKATKMGRGGVRAGSFKSRMGSGASYSDVRRRGGVRHSTAIVPIKAPSKSKRTYRRNMLNATTLEGVIATDSATQYAAAFAAPVITGGYNWCHLVGHGGGGTDQATNIVAASTHANSEQLEIERITYRYKRKGVGIQSHATLETGSQYLAKLITVEVYFNSSLIFSRVISGYRASKPTFTELSKVEVDLSNAIYKAADGY